MKTALLFFKLNDESFTSQRILDIYKIFEENQTEIFSSCILPNEDDLGFKRVLNEYVDTVESLIILGADKVTFDIKQIIAETFSLSVSVNEQALNLVEKFSNIKGVQYSNDYASFPETASIIPNSLSAYQGFILEKEDISVSVFPYEVKEIYKMLTEYYLVYMDRKLKPGDNYIFKHFGDTGFLKKTLEDIKKQLNSSVRTVVKTKHGDSLINLVFDNDDITQAEYLRRLSAALGDTLYADYDTTLQERLFSALTLHNLKISFAESFTAGRVASSVIAIPNASKIVHEGIFSYSNESKVHRLGVKQEDLDTLGAVSSKVAYEMALGLLRVKECDVAISTTGIAGPKSDNTLKPVGLCYIGIGMKDGIHVYKREFSGNREEITETAKNTALFLAIKKIKNL